MFLFVGHYGFVDSAPKALERLKTEPSIDLILSDYQMEGTTGIELLEQIRSIPDHRPFAIISGYGASANTEGPHQVDGILGKPVSRAGLAKLMTTMTAKAVG